MTAYSQPHMRGRLLFIENDRVRQTTIRRELVGMGYDVAEATADSEGLRFIEMVNPHLLLLGDMVTDAIADEFCSAVRRKFRTKRLAVIELSEFVQPEPKLDDILECAQGQESSSVDFYVLDQRIQRHLKRCIEEGRSIDSIEAVAHRTEAKDLADGRLCDAKRLLETMIYDAACGNLPTKEGLQLLLYTIDEELYEFKN